MNRRRLLTIGGPRSGEWVEVEGTSPIVFPVSKPLDLFGDSPLAPAYDRVVYNVTSLILFDRKVWVLLYSGVTDWNAALTGAIFNSDGQAMWTNGEPRPDNPWGRP